MVAPHIVIVSNDVVPGSEMPVAAPGLRAFGMAHGLAAHGMQAEVVVVSGPVEKSWQGGVPPPTQPGTIILPPNRLTEYLESRRPAIAVISNSNQIDHIEKRPGISIVLDFFAPKMLELAYRDDELPIDVLRALRERKKRAIAKADAFIVNGHKKIPYFLAWILQVDRDVREADLAVVPMAVPGKFLDRAPGSPIRLVNAGYLQGWSQHGAWLNIVRRMVDSEAFELHLLTPQHWGRPEPQSAEVEKLAAHESVMSHAALRFNDFQEFLAQADVSIDLFDWSWEREYAMVTRTVVALACGVPVIHPPFTEVAAVIAQYDAGWLVDPHDGAALESTLEQIRDHPDEVARKTANARTAWANVFEPRVATVELARVLRRLTDK